MDKNNLEIRQSYFNMRLSKEEKTKLKKLAEKNNVTLSSLVRQIVVHGKNINDII
jgi:predicted DNA-binding protein